MPIASAKDTRFRLSEAQANELAARYGTPLYVINETHLRKRIRTYVSAFKAAYPLSEISYASKANSTLAVLAIAFAEGCSIDVASEGELRAALAAGVPAHKCHLHGNNKTKEELAFALSAGVSHIVVDNFPEIELINTLAEGSARNTKLVLRLAPGVDPVTHAKISTGQADTKFGFNIVDGSAEKAVQAVLEHRLNLVGFHCHVGSQLLDPEAQRAGGELIAQFAQEMKFRHHFTATYLNIGGGLGVQYTDKDEPMEVDQYCKLVSEAVLDALGDMAEWPNLILGQEPGRAIIAESCVTLYRVGVQKTVPAKERGTRTYVCVDGGLSDNPRPALYGSKYTVEGFRDGPSQTVTVSGRHCETDKLFEDIELSKDLKVGDLIQVLCTGAYNSSMASNYNRYSRPATALIRPNGAFALIQRQDTWEEMLAREILPEGIGSTEC